MAADNASQRGQVDPAREEYMLKIQASILERCLRKEVQAKQNVEERCRVLRQKIIAMEDELSIAGKSTVARCCLEDSSRSEFDAVDHEEFLRWLASSSRSASNTPQQEHAHLRSSSIKRARDETDGFHVFSVAPPKPGRSPTQSKNPTKRVRYVSKESPPCLRCRVLKKKCDASDPCSHCPTQGCDSESDFWKVLGCFRGHLRDMAEIFCPDFSRATSRTLKHNIGGIDCINFVLTKSRVSDQKKRRIMHLIFTRADFETLSSFAWEDISTRESVSRSAISLTQHGGDEILVDHILQDYESVWAVLQLVSMDKIYLGKTAYNLFSLIKLGNSFSMSDQIRWELFFLAKRILRQSVELYLLEGLCAQIASGNMAWPAPFDTTSSTPNTLVLVDLKEDVETFLCNFEKICAGRAKLTGSSQLALFFALLVFSIAKSILTDAYSMRNDYEESSSWNAYYALKISSACRGLVSVFCWASKSDAMLPIEGEDLEYEFSLEQTRTMVSFRSWETLGFKGTKDFLLSLGSCLLPDGSYNGFLAQKFGIDRLSKISAKVEDEIQILRRGSTELGEDASGFEIMHQIHDSALQDPETSFRSEVTGTMCARAPGGYPSITFMPS